MATGRILTLVGGASIAGAGLEVAVHLPEEIEQMLGAVRHTTENIQGIEALWQITHIEPFRYDARRDRMTIGDMRLPRILITGGNSVARGHADYTDGRDADRQAAEMNRLRHTTMFNDHINPPGRSLALVLNSRPGAGPWNHWYQENRAMNGGKVADVFDQLHVLRAQGLLQTPIPKILIIGAGDNDTFLTPDIQSHFASLQQNIWQEETLHIARELLMGIGQSGIDLRKLLEWIDYMNVLEQWNVTDIFLLGSPYLRDSDGIVIKLSAEEYVRRKLAKGGQEQGLIDNVSDVINTMKAGVIRQFRADQPDASIGLHYLSMRLQREYQHGIFIPAQATQHFTLHGSDRITARMAFMTEDAAGNNLGELYFKDRYPLERDLRAA